MTDNEKEYREYLKDLSDLRVTMLSLFSGFTFTTIVLLLNQLPDPHAVLSQITLLFLAVMFELFLFLLQWQTTIKMGMWSDFKITSPPPRSRWELTVFNTIMSSAFTLWGISLAIILLLWSLKYLALAAGIAWILLTLINWEISRRTLKRLGWSPVKELKELRKKGLKEMER